MRKLLFVLVALVAFAVPAHAENPDHLPSITFLMGTGHANGWQTIDSDIDEFSLSLLYPASDSFTFIGGWKRESWDWDSGFQWRDWDSDVFSVGVKIYIR